MLRALLLQVFFSVRCERQLGEHIDYNLLFGWFVAAVNEPAKKYMSDEHFTVDGTNFHGDKRSNQTHESSTDADARLYKKSYGQESRLASFATVDVVDAGGEFSIAVLTRKCLSRPGRRDRLTLSIRRYAAPTVDWLCRG